MTIDHLLHVAIFLLFASGLLLSCSGKTGEGYKKGEKFERTYIDERCKTLLGCREKNLCPQTAAVGSEGGMTRAKRSKRGIIRVPCGQRGCEEKAGFSCMKMYND